MKQLILGGARSGKSRYAESQAKCSGNINCNGNGNKLIYIATGIAGDSEMTARIQQHQRDRGNDCYLIEEPIKLADELIRIDDENLAIVIDCMTLWLSNCLNIDSHSEKPALEHWRKQRDQFISTLPSLKADIFIVSNEVGSGVVPLGELSRVFVDESGWLHQELARVCDKVTLVMAGLPLALKN